MSTGLRNTITNKSLLAIGAMLFINIQPTISAPGYLTVKPLTPYITGIKTSSCVTPGKSTLTIYGQNFGKSYRKLLIAYSGSTRIYLKSIRWSNRSIYASIPKNYKATPGKLFFIRIEYRSKNKKLVRSNSRRAFTICRRTYPTRTKITSGTSISGVNGKPTPKPTPGTNGSGSRGTGSNNPGRGTTGTGGNNPGRGTTGTPSEDFGSFDGSGIDNSSPSNAGSGITNIEVRDKVSPPPTIPPANKKKNFITRQVMLTSNTMAQANKLYSELTKKGYKIVTRRNYRGLGMVVTILRTPDGVSATDAIATLRKKYKKSAIDKNTVYTLHAAKPETLKTMKRIRWSAPSASCGRGLKIGLLDSTIDTKHKAFRSRIIVQKNFTTTGSTPASRLHGTAIASQWLANPKSGIVGVIPGATLYSGAVFYKRGRQQISDGKLLVQGLDWLVLNRVDVINLSFGGPRNKVIEEALKKVLRKGISVVASAGNGGPKGGAVYPAAQPGVVAVTALTGRNKIYAYATRGNYIDLAAPGVNIQVAKPGNGKKYVTGTSFSAPYVSAALLILKRKRNLRSHNARIRWLKRKARSLGSAKIFGKGLLQVPGACSS